jgi:hypothetical protein
MQFDRAEEEREARKSQALLNFGLALMGAGSAAPAASESKVRTYFFNGRPVTCTETANTVICN